MSSFYLFTMCAHVSYHIIEVRLRGLILCGCHGNCMIITSLPATIMEKARGKVPVSVILILTLYVFVAIPLTMVEIFNTDMSISKCEESCFLEKSFQL